MGVSPRLAMRKVSEHLSKAKSEARKIQTQLTKMPNVSVRDLGKAISDARESMAELIKSVDEFDSLVVPVLARLQSDAESMPLSQQHEAAGMNPEGAEYKALVAASDRSAKKQSREADAEAEEVEAESDEDDDEPEAAD